MRLLLQHKIFIGYFLLMAVIGCMVAIVLHERKRVSEIEQESITIFQTQSNISTTHRHITVLATFGESVMTWTGKDCELYRTRRLKADSLLQILREQCKEFVRPEQVDSLRSQLLNKEEHLLRMKEIFRQQKQIDSLLAGQYSLVTSQANTSRTVTRKKKGIAGLFGGKETVQLPSANTKVRARGNELISLQEERRRNIETYTDLRIQPISQFRAQNTNTSPCYHIIEVMPVIVYSQVSRNCCYRIPCITNPWRHIPIFPVKKFSSHKCRSSMTGWKRISSITIRSFLFKRIFHRIDNHSHSCIRHCQNYCPAFKAMLPFHTCKV